jgi:hypothetical protein
MSKFEFGDLVRDTVSKFEGIVMVSALYSTGCTHYGLAPQELDKDGEPRKWEWFDQTRLEVLQEGRVKFDMEKKIIGGPAPHPNHI